MQRLYSLTLPALAALALAGCSTTSGGGGSSSGRATDVYDKLASGMTVSTVHTNSDTTSTGSAVVTMPSDGETLRVAMGDTVYDLALESKETDTLPGLKNPVEYTGYKFRNEDASGGAYLIAGRYVAVGVYGTDDGQNTSVMRGGVETPSGGPPNQSAVYEGIWAAPNSHMIGEGGVFEADANFDAGSIRFDFKDDSGTNVGSGAGSISGNAFNSTYNASRSSGNVTGNFYGPNAEEIAGLIEGTAEEQADFGEDGPRTGGPVGGWLLGHKQ